MPMRTSAAHTVVMAAVAVALVAPVRATAQNHAPRTSVSRTADAPPGTPDARGVSDARPQPDAPFGTPDARPMPDAGGGPTCSGTPTDCGAPPSSFAMNQPKIVGSKFFVVRDSGGLYAVSAKCTHEGATNGVSGGVFLCPRHGAQFTFNGDIISGPVFTGLVHYQMCVLGNGNVGVNTAVTVSQSTRM